MSQFVKRTLDEVEFVENFVGVKLGEKGDLYAVASYEAIPAKKGRNGHAAYTKYRVLELITKVTVNDDKSYTLECKVPTIEMSSLNCRPILNMTLADKTAALMSIVDRDRKLIKEQEAAAKVHAISSLRLERDLIQEKTDARIRAVISILERAKEDLAKGCLHFPASIDSFADIKLGFSTIYEMDQILKAFKE